MKLSWRYAYFFVFGAYVGAVAVAVIGCRARRSEMKLPPLACAYFFVLGAYVGAAAVALTSPSSPSHCAYPSAPILKST